MHNDPKDQKSDTGNMRITFPPPPGMDLKAGQDIVLNGITANIRPTADGQLELSGDEFIAELIRLGFRVGRNDSPERLEEIVKNIPAEFRQDFLDGFNGKPRK